MRRVLLAATVMAGTWVGSAAVAEEGEEAFLGVVIQDLSGALAEALDLDRPEGALISQVIEDSPAQRAGLEVGDVLVELKGEPIGDADDVIEAIAEAEVGEEIDLRWMRHGDWKTGSVVLGERSPERSWSFHFSDYFGDGGCRIGIELTPLRDGLGEPFGVEDGEGLLVLSVEEDSPAARAGLRGGDVIVGVGEQRVATRDELSDALEKAAGETVELRRMRRGTRGSARLRGLKLEVPEHYGKSIWHGRAEGLPHAVRGFCRQGLERIERSELPQTLREWRPPFAAEELRGSMAELESELREAMEKLREDMEELRLELGEEQEEEEEQL